MTYPVAIGHRMAWDRDGSAGYFFTTPTGPIVLATGSQMREANSETAFNYVGLESYYAGVMFPELRDLEGYFLGGYNGGGGPVLSTRNIETSVDTTDGSDGTWISHGAVSIYAAQYGYYRTYATSLVVPAIKAFRIVPNAGGMTLQQLHLYGKPSTAIERVAIWDPVSDIEIGLDALDPGILGSVSRGTTYSRTFRVKNLSATQTATNTLVFAETLADNTPSVIEGITFSIDASPYTSNITIASIAPAAISSVITMSYAVDSAAELAINNPRIVAQPSSFAP